MSHLARFSRVELTARLAGLLDGLIDSSEVDASRVIEPMGAVSG